MVHERLTVERNGNLIYTFTGPAIYDRTPVVVVAIVVVVFAVVVDAIVIVNEAKHQHLQPKPNESRTVRREKKNKRKKERKINKTISLSASHT